MNDLLLLTNLLDGPKHGYALKKQVGLISGQEEMHNNLVYPLLRRFVESGWVSKRQGTGERGQTRDIYSLTGKGKQELLRRLSDATSKELASENAFHLRVGLFAVLDAATRGRILAERDRWLGEREERLGRLEASMDLGLWGGEVVRFRREQIRSERKWIAGLKRKAERAGRKRG
jgi:DNA-binding PadR family transcriptional regulator